MSKCDPSANEKEMGPECDCSRGVRGKYAARCAEGSNVIVLDPDVAEFFGTSRAVNEALGLLEDAARRKSKESGGESSERMRFLTRV